MRTILPSLLAVAALSACGPGTVIVVREPISNPRPVQRPTPTPAPAPAPAPLSPLEVDIGRPHRGQLLVQTNRPAYVALFEIVPGQGVTLVHPSSARERRFMISGPRRMPVWFEEARVTPAASRGPAREPVRYIYALASDEPLRITDEAFLAGYMRRVLGPITYRGEHPYATMRAIASRFAPSVQDEKWAEDAIALGGGRREPQHIARVYCPGGVVMEIPEELADRAWCPGRRGNTPGSAAPADDPPPSRPDSVKGNNGRRVQMRAHGTPGEQPRSRVREGLTVPAAGQPAAGQPGAGQPAGQPTPGQPGAGPAQGTPGNGAQDGDRPGQRRGQGEDRPGNRRGQTEDKPGNGPPPGAGVPGMPAQPQSTGQPQGQPQPAAQPQTTGRPESAGRPAGTGRPEHAGRPSTPQADAPKPGNGDRGQPNAGQQAERKEPATQQPGGNAPGSQPPAVQPPATQPSASPPSAAQPATPGDRPAAAQPGNGQPSTPAQGNQPQGRGQPKVKAGADSASSAPPAAPDTSAKPGKGRPPAAGGGRPPAPDR